MRICIIATGRCGSTSLAKCIEEHLTSDYTFLTEPLDQYNKTEENLTSYNDTENILLKMLIGQTPDMIEENVKLFYKSIFETFDKVIILDRKSKLEQSESFAFNTKHKFKDIHNIKRVYYLNSISKDVMDEWNMVLNQASKLLRILSNEYSSKIYYYEDIFVNKNKQVINEIFNYLELVPNKESIDSWIISDNKKVRIKEKHHKLL